MKNIAVLHQIIYGAFLKFKHFDVLLNCTSEATNDKSLLHTYDDINHK